MRALAALAFGLLVPALGCSATVADEDDGVDVAAGSTQGTVTVERSETVTAGPGAARVSTRVLARFVQVSGGLDHAFADRVVGSPRDLPVVGSCEWRTTASIEPLPTVAAEGTIDLLDVGDVVLHAGDDSMPLAPRAFPDVGDLVSGIVYSSRDDSTALPAGASYEMETTGSEFAEGFRLSMDAPPAPEHVQVAAVEIEAASDLALAVGEPLALQWKSGSNPHDRIIVELAPLASDGRLPSTAWCVFYDDGEATVPEAFVSWGEEEVEEVDVSVHRFRRTLLRAPEIDEAVVEFDFAVAVRLPVAYEP